jgi:hypothetical protein
MAEIVTALEKILGFLVAILFAVGGWVWKVTHAKVEAMEAGKATKADLQALALRIDGKADQSEMNRQRDNIAELFDGQTAIRKEMHDNHIATITAISGLATQVATLAGRMTK